MALVKPKKELMDKIVLEFGGGCRGRAHRLAERFGTVDYSRIIGKVEDVSSSRLP